MKQEITEALLTGLRPPASGRIEVQDGRVPALVLRITGGDVRSWSVRGRLSDGRRVRVTLGKYPQTSIREARQKARKALGDISDGKDRIAEKRAEREARIAATAAPTVKQRLEEWCAANADRWSERYRDEIERVAVTTIFPELGDKPLTTTTRADWIDLVARLRKRTPAKASWCYSLISALLNYAEAAGWLPTNPLPRRGRSLIAPPVAARERVLSDDELIRVWQASVRLTPKSRAFSRLLMMTAARVSEVAGIAVGEVHHLHRQWTIPSERAKNGHALMVPLHALVYDELMAIWPAEHVGTDYRLLGAIRGSALQAPMKTKYRLDKLSGVTGWRLHDLRRTARTTMARLGVADRAGEAAMNHVSDRSQLVRVYDRHDYAAEALKALRTWQDHVAGLVGAAPIAGQRRTA